MRIPSTHFGETSRAELRVTSRTAFPKKAIYLTNCTTCVNRKILLLVLTANIIVSLIKCVVPNEDYVILSVEDNVVNKQLVLVYT